MAKVANAFLTYDAQANREDLSDIIYNIDPFDTPMMTAAGRRNISNVVYDWQTEALPAVSVTGELEGFEITREVSTATVRVSDVAQINARNATISGTQDASNPAGKRKEMAHQIALIGKALKRDCETVLFGTDQVRVLGGTAVVRATTGLINWIATNSVFGAGGADPVQSTQTAITDGTQTPLTEAEFNDGIQLGYESGAEPSFFFVGPWVKRVISGFVGRTNSRQMIAAKKIVNSVTMYASDFGDIKVLPTRWIRPRDGFLMDPRYFRVAFFRNFQRTTMGLIGDADTELILTEYGLQVDTEAAHVVFRDLSTS